MAPREGEEPLAASSWFRIHAIRPCRSLTQTRAHHSILLERPLTMGEMRANVFVARSREPELSKGLTIHGSRHLGASTRMGEGGGAMPPPRQGGDSAFVYPLRFSIIRSESKCLIDSNEFY